jgi:hypothetical protein
MLQSKFKDTKGVIRSDNLKDRQYNDQMNKDKNDKNDHKTLHRKLKIGQHEPQ